MTDTPRTAKWAPVQVPPFCERLIGYSVPTSNRCLVVSYEAVHLLTLDDPVTVQTDEDFAEYDIYDPDTETAAYSGITYSIVGLHGGHPMLTTPQGDRLELDRTKQTLTVTTGELITLSTAYENFSGDWAVATFSLDGRYLLLGCPYDFDFRVWQRAI